MKSRRLCSAGTHSYFYDLSLFLCILIFAEIPNTGCSSRPETISPDFVNQPSKYLLDGGGFVIMHHQFYIQPSWKKGVNLHQLSKDIYVYLKSGSGRGYESQWAGDQTAKLRDRDAWSLILASIVHHDLDIRTTEDDSTRDASISKFLAELGPNFLGSSDKCVGGFM